MHRLRSNILLALLNISLYRFRVALNLLGLIFGVSSVIVVRAIAEGAMAGAADHRLIALPATQSSAHKLAFSKDATYTILFASIAAIALLAGGIGIMNIMLATVSARTREIGIRRASGARRRDIIEQFLIEASVISAAGALIGVMVGIAVPPVFSWLSGITVLIRPLSAVIAFLIAVSIGVTAGIYPACRAANLEPVDALRDE